MSRRLPDRPDLDHLRKEAKALLRAHREGDPSARQTLRHIARLANLPDSELSTAAVSLQEAQHALARDYGFKHWPALKDEVASRAAPTRGDLLVRLRSARVRTRKMALRQYAMSIHPHWTLGTPFGWGLAQPASTLPEGLEPLYERLTEDPNWRIRREAVSALAAYAHLGDSRVDTALRRALSDSRHAVQHAAARALGAPCPGCGKTPNLAEYVET